MSEIWVPQSLAHVLIWQEVCSPWASPYGARQVHGILNGVTPIQQFQRYAFRKVWTQFLANLTKVVAHGQAHMGQMGKWPWQCTATVLDNFTELRTGKIHLAVTEIWFPQIWQPPARTVTTIEIHSKGWGVNRALDGMFARSINHLHSFISSDIINLINPQVVETHCNYPCDCTLNHSLQTKVWQRNVVFERS